MNENIREGKTWLRVEDCWESTSKTSGNPYWGLKCTILQNPSATRRNNIPAGEVCVYFMKKFEWALQNLQDIVVACDVKKPWELFGKVFVADVVVKNGFVSLRKPRSASHEAESEATEPADINAKSEWPW